MSGQQARYGWGSSFPAFSRTPARVIRGHLEEFARDAGERQVRAWDDTIPPLQREVEEVLSVNEDAAAYSAILEYELPLESRRPDVVLLARSAVVILELKGKLSPAQADLDQASAYFLVESDGGREPLPQTSKSGHFQLDPCTIRRRPNGGLGVGTIHPRSGSDGKEIFFLK